ncbi:MAG: hypothetical protein SVX28_11260 [Pseudomonadota bacterium]|nr:hypothetical protein [Pseudomonadota bacterium]
MNSASSGMRWIKGAGVTDMRRVMLLCVFALVLSNPVAAASGDHHQYITDKIAHYSSAFERCKNVADERTQPEDGVLSKLREYPKAQVERFLMTRYDLAMQECTKPESLELAYAILVTETLELEQQTKDAISAIKELAFSGDNRKLEVMYLSLPEEMRQSLERLGYFKKPFDDRLVLEMVSK